MLLLRLIRRNILVYSRDRANIFFSLLATIIVIGNMVLFLGKMNTDNIVGLLNEYGGVRDAVADRANAEQMILLWTLAGIIIVNSVTITLSMIGIMIEDQALKRLPSFYVSPVNRTIFVLGYVIAAFIMGVIMCTLTLLLGEMCALLSGGQLLSLATLTKTMLYIMINVFSSTTMMFLIANLVHTTSAFTGLSTIIGTLVGFLAGIYLPLGMLPEKVQTVVKCLPMLHGASILREVITRDMLAVTFVNCPVELISEYKKAMGITLLFDERVISNGFKISFLLISGIVFIGISAFFQRRSNVMAR